MNQSSYFPQDLNWIFIQQPNHLESFSNLCYFGSLSAKELSLPLTLIEKTACSNFAYSLKAAFVPQN